MNPSIKASLSVVLSFVSLPMLNALTPAPDGGYPGGNTAEGQNALLSLATGMYNTAVGFLSLQSDTTGNFNTAIGAGALLSNTAAFNTAAGSGALLSNTTGFRNTGDGAFALFNNTDGAINSAFGAYALFSNTEGTQNTAIGVQALYTNTTGQDNTAAGYQALFLMTEIQTTSKGLTTRPSELMRLGTAPRVIATALSVGARWETIPLASTTRPWELSHSPATRTTTPTQPWALELCNTPRAASIQPWVIKPVSM